jgi:large subunit ribosomal protein L35
MPKMKSHRGAKKRLHYTAGGKLMHARTGRRHHLYVKNARRRRRLRSPGQVSRGDLPRTRRLLPYD